MLKYPPSSFPYTCICMYKDIHRPVKNPCLCSIFLMFLQLSFPLALTRTTCPYSRHSHWEGGMKTNSWRAGRVCILSSSPSPAYTWVVQALLNRNPILLWFLLENKPVAELLRATARHSWAHELELRESFDLICNFNQISFHWVWVFLFGCFLFL